MRLLIYSQTRSLGMDKWSLRTLYIGCNYLSMLGFKLNHVSKRGPRMHRKLYHIISHLILHTWQERIISTALLCSWCLKALHNLLLLSRVALLLRSGCAHFVSAFRQPWCKILRRRHRTCWKSYCTHPHYMHFLIYEIKLQILEHMYFITLFQRLI